MEYYNQCRSNFRKGEPPDHKLGKELTTQYLEHFGIFTIEEYPLRVWYGFSELLKRDKGRTDPYQHDYDLAGFCIGDYIVNSEGEKIMLAHFANLPQRDIKKSKYKDLLDKKVKILIEMDDPWLHSKIQHQINDGVAQEYAKEKMPQAIFVRLNKHEVTTPIVQDRYNYLAKYLMPFLPKQKKLF